MLIYFAAPLFSEAERRFNLDLTTELESLGFRVFLPIRAALAGVALWWLDYPESPREVQVRALVRLIQGILVPLGRPGGEERI